ncbi:Granule-bound starch synthase 1, chloroplastic/amyloplastic [Hondaea fermentalgiana]|uniref:Granule-bound starch synthase 1, chloroplastic/amyloplastic n=1 Tax=Hondaea fermentalgiana TaxID=2315210 RepID=A0A2R5GD08_9STRA|nr:Granule-bound starch synthase 1, chloroplastic/amyloplastic [Hondaea fermentalgiana]|eukprot:GBG26051.1 Granule-bound starch synthase 1, chloroplastic/amyloplastic [Hondaea fermentalgiana]
MAPNHSSSAPTAAAQVLSGQRVEEEVAEVAPRAKVLIISPVFPPQVAVGGGVAVTVGALTDKLIHRGCVVKVLSPRLFNVDFGTSSLYKSFPVQFPTVFNLRLFYREIKEADVLVCPDNTVMPFLLYFCHLLGKPLVFNLHTNVRKLLEMTGPFGRYVSAPICDGFIRSCSNMTARTFTTSPSYREVLQKRGYRVDAVFSPRIKLAIFEVEDSQAEIDEARKLLSKGAVDKTLLIYVGRFSHEKRIDLLARAKPAECVLAIVGDGPGEAGDDVERLHDPASHVHVFRGMQGQARLRVFYKASDFLVSASNFETLGMTVAEANLCDTPAICERATGFDTQIVHGENGFLINYDDSESAREAIRDAIKHKPTAAMIRKVIGGDQRWDHALPNLEDLVLEIADVGNDKSRWGSGPLPLWIMTPAIVFFYVMFWIVGFPFNQVTNFADRKNPGPAIFNSKRLAPKASSAAN